MSAKEWIEDFAARFKRLAGREPTPLELANNLPRTVSDGDAMNAMVLWMERCPHGMSSRSRCSTCNGY